MHRRCAMFALAGLIVYASAGASTLCESSGNPTSTASAPAAPAVTQANQGPVVQTAPLAPKPAPRSSNRDDTVVAAGGSSPAGDDDAAANLGTPGAGVHRHGLRWQSLLPGVIK